MSRHLIAILALALAAPPLAAQTTVDPSLPSYTPAGRVSGTLSSVGSDTMNNLMTLWAESFRKIHPNVRVQVEGKGSSTAPAALIAGTAQLGPMSREMKDSERDAIEAKYGFAPTRLGTALDTIGVFVHQDNPIRSLSIQEVDAIFSRARKGGFPHDITTWGQVGLKDDWARRPLSLYGRNAASGTYGFFKDHALNRGDFKNTVKEQPGSASVVQGIGADKAGIGYSGIGYTTSSVRAIPLAAKVGGNPIAPTYENALSGAYPLSRQLYVYVVRDPRRPTDPLTLEFLRFVLSRQGQEIVVKDGYLPLPASLAAEELARLQ